MNEPEKTGEIRNGKGQFVKGVSGNPSGRPLGSLSVVAEIKKQLDEVAEEDPMKRKKLVLLVRRLILKAINDGDSSMIKDIIDRVDGRPRQSIEIEDMREDTTKDKLNELIEKLNSNEK